jgi:hypothetical protein
VPEGREVGSAGDSEVGGNLDCDHGYLLLAFGSVCSSFRIRARPIPTDS